MTALLVRRLVWIVPNMILITFLLFAVMSGWMGSPSAMMLGTDASPDAIRQLDHHMGFDRPIPIQYALWIGRALIGDFGRSYVTHQTVASMILPAFPVTLELALWTIVLSTVVAVVSNSLVVARRLIGGLVTWLSMIGITIPNFMLGTSLIYLLSVRLRWLPTTGWVPWSAGPADHLLHLVMPVLTLSAFYFGSFSLIYRAEYQRVSRHLFVRVAEAKGLSETRVSFRHVLPNAIVPVITYAGISLGHLVGGAVVTETIFSIPGLGRVFVTAISSYDYPVILALGMLILAGVMLTNLGADLLLAAMNPTVRL
jgi:peptide/nickel transport system permease protein